jgi:hypothetical protein
MLFSYRVWNFRAKPRSAKAETADALTWNNQLRYLSALAKHSHFGRADLLPNSL